MVVAAWRRWWRQELSGGGSTAAEAAARQQKFQGQSLLALTITPAQTQQSRWHSLVAHHLALCVLPIFCRKAGRVGRLIYSTERSELSGQCGGVEEGGEGLQSCPTSPAPITQAEKNEDFFFRSQPPQCSTVA
jgi:hypothetical protein